MAIERLSYQKDWTDPDDFPTYEENEEQVRADLQFHPDAVKTYLNGTLLPFLESGEAAGELGTASGPLQGALDGILERLEQAEEDISAAATGGVPAAVQCVRLPFTAGSWSALDGGGVSLSFPQAQHRRTGDGFGYTVFSLSGEAYAAGTWAAASVRVVRDADGGITLTAPAAFAGAVAFFGL